MPTDLQRGRPGSDIETHHAPHQENSFRFRDVFSKVNRSGPVGAALLSLVSILVRRVVNLPPNEP